MTQRFTFPGLNGSAPRSFLGRAAAGPPPVPVPGFVLSNNTVVAAWGTVVVGELTPINAPPGVIFRLKETAGASGEEAGLAVVNG